MKSQYLYRAAAASAIVTPTNPVPLAGAIDRTLPFQAVHDDLEINVILLAAGENRALFISFDLLFVGASLSDLACRLAESRGIARSCVILTASHTHFAPATDASKPLLGRTDETFLGHVARRLESLFDEVFSRDLEEIQLEWSEAHTQLNINRRLRWPFPTLTRGGLRLRPSTIMSPNAASSVDSRLDMLRLRRKDGTLLALVWKYACHPVSFPLEMSVSAEFPGYVRAQLRDYCRDKIPVIFWQGFSGDVRPKLSGSSTLSTLIRTVRSGPGFRPIDLETWRDWAKGLSEAAGAAICAPGLTLEGGFSISASALPLGSLMDCANSEPATHKQLRVQRLTFGSTLKAFFVSAEVCSPYVFRVGVPLAICVGCVGDVFGYLPTQAQVAEGGYEAGGFFQPFGLDCRFGDRLDDCWTELMKGLDPPSDPHSESSSEG